MQDHQRHSISLLCRLGGVGDRRFNRIKAETGQMNLLAFEFSGKSTAYEAIWSIAHELSLAMQAVS